jgi:hypothetical protein
VGKFYDFIRLIDVSVGLQRLVSTALTAAGELAGGVRAGAGEMTSSEEQLWRAKGGPGEHSEGPVCRPGYCLLHSCPLLLPSVSWRGSAPRFVFRSRHPGKTSCDEVL